MGPRRARQRRESPVRARLHQRRQPERAELLAGNRSVRAAGEMNRWSALAVLLAIAGALALRVPKLDTRPLHNDEAVNAVKVGELWQQGRYAYDPDEYHGPTLHYATLPFLVLSGARNADELADSTLRLAPVVCGVG